MYMLSVSVRFFVFLFLFSLSFSCNKQAENKGDRPIQNWVFRSVLDSQPRMITLALSDAMWVSYHAATGAIYKAWKGSVYFDGAVYTTTHGPQPISIGNSYFENKFKTPWVISSGKDTIASTLQYKGHRFVNGSAELVYEIHSPSIDKPLKVYEGVEYNQDNGHPILQRTFTTEQVPSNITIALNINLSSIITEDHISTDGKWSIKNKSEQVSNERKTLNIDGLLQLNSNGKTQFNSKFTIDPVITNNNVIEEEESEEDKSEGMTLIAQSDCKTCHNKNLQTIGPPYVAIAKKYDHTSDNVVLLANKIINGGSGIWGQQVMTPHKDLSIDDAQKMVEYIFSLAEKTESSQVSKGQQIFNLNPIESISEGDLLIGSLVKVYPIPSNTDKMPIINANQKPKFAGVLSNFNNLSGNDFKELDNNFALIGTGYIKIDTPGLYSFHVWSDDGSLLYINDQLVLDNDGLHGTDYKEVNLTLKKGYYPYRLEYFQAAGGKFLSFNWKSPTDKEFVVIPTENLMIKSASLLELKDQVLPMSIASKIPGDIYPLEDVHPSFDLFQARPESFRPKVGGLDFLSDGRLVVCTWDEEGGVYILENTDSGDATKIKVKKIAFGLAEPLGLKVVNDTIYIMQKHEMTRLIDDDGDEIIDYYETLCDKWRVSANFHEFGFGLEYVDGHFYATLATAINPGGASTQPQIPDRGKVIKVNKNTGELSFVASGLRTPNGIGKGFNGDLFVADNEGDWLPSSKIVHISNDAWFGSRSVDFQGTAGLKEKLPVVWLPQDEIGNSPSTPTFIDKGPYKGQMIHGEVTNGGIKRVFVEEVNGLLQGCVFRFCQGLEAGVNRIAWSPKGDLYVGGIGNPGNWQHSGKKSYGLQRLVYNNKSTFEMLAIRAKTNGIEIEFTEPLHKLEAIDIDNYLVKQWYYKPTEQYGGPKLGEKELKINGVSLSKDSKKVFLEIKGLQENHVVYVRLKKHFISKQDQQIRSTEAWYTMNQIPKDNFGTSSSENKILAHNTLSAEEKEEGWKLLFDGKSLSSWRNFKKNTIGKDWIINDGAIHLNASKNEKGHWQTMDGGDIITTDTFENFDFKIQWKIASCGNSGIMFNIVESDKYDYVWNTGPEMQILDNTCHPDTKYKTHRAGDLYDMIESKYPASKPAGNWNDVRIVSNKGNVDFWLNGIKVVNFKMHTPEWKALIANSKFKNMPGFGMAKSGHIALQDHGDKVWFRNIKIKKL